MPAKKISQLTELTTGASGDFLPIVDTSTGETKKIDWDNLPSGGGGGGGDSWGDAVDADIIPDADGTRDLGSSANRFAEVHTDSLDIAGSTAVTGVLDEDDMTSDSATDLATQQSIKAYVDAQAGGSDTNCYVFHYADTGTTSKYFVSDTLTEISSGQNDYRAIISMPSAGEVSKVVITGAPNSGSTYHIEVYVNGSRVHTGSATAATKGSLTQIVITGSSWTYSANDYLAFRISGNGTGGALPSSIGSCSMTVQVTNS